MNKSSIAAIEFGTSKIVTIIGKPSGQERIKILGSGTVPYDGYMNGVWNTEGQMLKRVSDSIAAAELESNTHITELYVGVPGDYILVREAECEIELPEGRATNADLEAIKDLAAEKLQIAERGNPVLHRSAAWYQIDNGPKKVVVSGNGKMLRARISFVLADEQFIADIKEIMSQLGITILGFLSSTFGEAMLMIPKDERDITAVLIDCGYLETEISVACGEALIYHAMLPLGGGHITAALATKFSIPMRSAERLKRKFRFDVDEFTSEEVNETYASNGRKVSFPREDIEKCVEDTVKQITDMIDLTLSNEVDELTCANSKIYLSGGGLMMSGARDFVEQKIQRPITERISRSGKLKSETYDSVQGLLDLITASLDGGVVEKSGFGSVLTGFLKRN